MKQGRALSEVLTELQRQNAAKTQMCSVQELLIATLAIAYFFGRNSIAFDNGVLRVFDILLCPQSPNFLLIPHFQFSPIKAQKKQPKQVVGLA